MAERGSKVSKNQIPFPDPFGPQEPLTPTNKPAAEDNTPKSGINQPVQRPTGNALDWMSRPKYHVGYNVSGRGAKDD